MIENLKCRNLGDQMRTRHLPQPEEMQTVNHFKASIVTIILYLSLVNYIAMKEVSSSSHACIHMALHTKAALCH